MELYRIQSRFNESMWYSFKGKYTNRFEEITGQFGPFMVNHKIDIHKNNPTLLYFNKHE